MILLDLEHEIMSLNLSLLLSNLNLVESTVEAKSILIPGESFAKCPTTFSHEADPSLILNIPDSQEVLHDPAPEKEN